MPLTVYHGIAGLMDKATALRRLALHSPNNQICILSQALADKHLHYHATMPIS